MSLISLNSAIQWPGILENLGANIALATVETLDAAGEYYSIVYCAREPMVVSHIGVRFGVATGSPTVTVGIETVSATGFPSGTPWATDTTATTGAITSNTHLLSALTASATIAAGQMFAVVVRYISGTSIVIQHLAGLGTNLSNVPYAALSTGSPVKGRMAGTTLFALGSSATTFYSLDGTLPLNVYTNVGFNNTNSAANGCRFRVPFKCRAAGICMHHNNQAGDWNLVLYNDAGTELSSSSTLIDGDTTGNSTLGIYSYYFDSPVVLLPGVDYRVAVEPTSATNAGMPFFTLPSANYRSAWPGGTNYTYTTRASGVWDDTGTDKVPLIDLLLDQLDNGKSFKAGLQALEGGLVQSDSAFF